MTKIELHDKASGDRALIAPERGFNCYSFAPVIDGQPHELLWAVEGFERGEGRPSGSGIPLLFPFAGRIRGTSFEWFGETYELPPGDALGNAIHGFVIDRPWKVLEQSATQAVAEFQASREAPDLEPHWPCDYRIRVSYELRAPHVLASVIHIENPGAEPLPFWFGTHPYFRVPLVAGGAADACVVDVPAAEYWELREMLPTGMRLPADGDRRLAGGLPFARTKLDDVFTGLASRDGRVATSIVDPQSQLQLTMEFSAEYFRECVVYNPPHREAICIEPYTAAPDAFTLEDRHIESGLLAIAPGESITLAIDIGLRSTR